METEKREAYVDKKITWHRGKCGGTDSGYICDSDDCSAVSPPANGGRACERDDYAFSTTSEEYYSEGEAYSQKSDRVHTYAVKEQSK